MEQIEKINNRIARNYYPLPWTWGIFFAGWIPGVVLHELSHYLMAKLLRVEVRAVVLFQFSSAFFGAVFFEEEEEDAIWKMILLSSAPLFIVLPVFVAFILFVAIPAMKRSLGWWVPVIWIGMGLFSNSFPD